jgi:hypothetical protein
VKEPDVAHGVGNGGVEPSQHPTFIERFWQRCRTCYS